MIALTDFLSEAFDIFVPGPEHSRPRRQQRALMIVSVSALLGGAGLAYALIFWAL